jgi:hypothetical protein
MKAIRVGLKRFGEKRSAGIREKRLRKIERRNQPQTTLPPGLNCPVCKRKFKVYIGLHSHYRAHINILNIPKWKPIFYKEEEPTKNGV